MERHDEQDDVLLRSDEGPDGTSDPVDVVDADTVAVAREALTRVDAILGGAGADIGEGDPPGHNARSAISRSLRRGWDDLMTEARAVSAATDHRDRLEPLIDVLNIVHTAEGMVASSPTLPGSPVGRVRECLQSLDTAGSLEDMVDRAPVIAAGLGFDRVLLSRVEESTWIPERLYFKGDTRWAQEVLDAMSERPLDLNTSLLETRMVRQAVPLRVVDPATRPLMNRLMVQLSHTVGYIAAPIVDAGTVVGFVHADCYYQGRVPSQGDVETLWAFSQALGPMFARQSLTERLATLRQEVDAPVLVMGHGHPGASADRKEPPRPAPPRVGHEPRRGADPQDLVTPREVDVLRLMSEGASNEQIARRLVISVGTVKSHVKRILRKLDVANRAEAASLWLRSEYDRMASAPDEH